MRLSTGGRVPNGTRLSGEAEKRGGRQSITGPKHRHLVPAGEGRIIRWHKDFLSRIGGLRDDFSYRGRKL